MPQSTVPALAQGQGPVRWPMLTACFHASNVEVYVHMSTSKGSKAHVLAKPPAISRPRAEREIRSEAAQPRCRKGCHHPVCGELSTKHCTRLDLHTSLASPYICFTPHLTFEHNELQGVAFLMPFPRNRHHS